MSSIYYALLVLIQYAYYEILVLLVVMTSACHVRRLLYVVTFVRGVIKDYLVSIYGTVSTVYLVVLVLVL